MRKVSCSSTSAGDTSFAMVAGRWYSELMDDLISGARMALETNGVDEDNIYLIRCPGSFEIPQVARQVADSRSVDGIICLGILIQGQTRHFDFIASAVTRQLQRLGGQVDVPISFGVLTCDTEAQARVRCDPDGKDKGGSAARAALEMATLYSIL